MNDNQFQDTLNEIRILTARLDERVRVLQDNSEEFKEKLLRMESTSYSSIARLEERVKTIQANTDTFKQNVEKLEASSCGSINSIVWWGALLLLVFIAPVIQHVMAK
jgi:hypothetical protein